MARLLTARVRQEYDQNGINSNVKNIILGRPGRPYSTGTIRLQTEHLLGTLRHIGESTYITAHIRDDAVFPDAQQATGFEAGIQDARLVLGRRIICIGGGRPGRPRVLR
jgi:hypothetical protein